MLNDPGSNIGKDIMKDRIGAYDYSTQLAYTLSRLPVSAQMDWMLQAMRMPTKTFNYAVKLRFSDPRSN